MALSNIWREPRREITETLVGVGAIGSALAIDILFTLHDISSGPLPKGMTYCGAFIFDMIAFPVIGALAFYGLKWAAIGVHAIGESLCDALDRRGLQLRPKQRW